MSLMSAAPRFAQVALDRARLSVVPPRRLKARRVPFVTVVCVILAVGVAGLLAFNTQMQQAAFTASELEAKAADMASERQALEMKLERLRDPQRLAEAGRNLGMVAPPAPAFISLADGSVKGNPMPADPNDAIPIKQQRAFKPPVLRPDPIIVTVPRASTAQAAPTDRTGE